MTHWTGSFAVALMLVLGIVAGGAQQQPAAAGNATAAGRGATAPPPITWLSPPLPDGPIVLDTGIQHQIRLFVTKGFH
jgi:hypothetical protein